MTEHDFKKFPELTNAQMDLHYWESPHKQIMEDFTAKVVKVTDGDTIRVEWTERDFNFPIRLLDIDAPEMNFDSGKRSQKWLEDLILGKEVDVIIEENQRVDKWGRLLGVVLFEGMNIGELSMGESMSVAFGRSQEHAFIENQEIAVS